MVLPLFLGRFETDALQTTTLFVATSSFRSSWNTTKVARDLRMCKPWEPTSTHTLCRGVEPTARVEPVPWKLTILCQMKHPLGPTLVVALALLVGSLFVGSNLYYNRAQSSPRMTNSAYLLRLTTLSSTFSTPARSARGNG